MSATPPRTMATLHSGSRIGSPLWSLKQRVIRLQRESLPFSTTHHFAVSIIFNLSSSLPFLVDHGQKLRFLFPFLLSRFFWSRLPVWKAPSLSNSRLGASTSLTNARLEERRRSPENISYLFSCFFLIVFRGLLFDENLDRRDECLCLLFKRVR